MKSAGYRVALQYKQHVGPPTSFPYEHIPGADDLTNTSKFIRRDAAQPWFMVYASNDPHGPWNRGPTYDPAKLTVPPYLHDNSETRGELAKYYAVRDVRYKLNRNLAPDKTYTIGGIHKGEPIQSWQEDAKHDSKLAARIAWLFNRPAEELYDLDSDPYEMKNLASEPQFASTKARLQKQLDHWIQQQGYKGMETELLANTRQGKSDEDESKGKKAKVKK